MKAVKLMVILSTNRVFLYGPCKAPQGGGGGGCGGGGVCVCVGGGGL